MMFTNTKYIVHNYAAYIFPSFINHAQFAINMGMDKQDINGAGFVSFGEDGQLRCYGKSVGLGIESRGKEDERHVRKLIYGEE